MKSSERMNPVYFISGHLNLSQDEFELHYKNQIEDALKKENSSFIIGDARGCDLMAQNYLSTTRKDVHVIIFHMFGKPRNNPWNFPTVSGFKSDEARDAEMTYQSDFDILWVRSIQEQKVLLGKKYKEGRISGTEQNQKRRISMNENKNNLSYKHL